MFDFLNKPNSPLAERARSPLYGSFVISWFIWNWRIILTIFLFKSEDYHGLNVVQYISTTYLNMKDCIWIPLAMAAGYILFVPWIDYLIIWYSEHNKRVKIDKKIEIGRKHFVEGNMYYDLRLKYEDERKEILDIENKLTKAKSDALKAENELEQLNIELNNIVSDKNFYEQKWIKVSARHNLEGIFYGRWVFETRGPLRMVDRHSKREIIRTDIEVKENKINEVENNVSSLIYEIDLIDFDPDNKKLSFIKRTPGNYNKIIICKLDIINNNTLEGTENTDKVTYKRSVFMPEYEEEANASEEVNF